MTWRWKRFWRIRSVIFPGNVGYYLARDLADIARLQDIDLFPIPILDDSKGPAVNIVETPESQAYALFAVDPKNDILAVPLSHEDLLEFAIYLNEVIDELTVAEMIELSGSVTP